MNKVNAIASGREKPNQTTSPKQGERKWCEEKCLVAKSILEWLLRSIVMRNLFSSPSETQI